MCVLHDQQRPGLIMHAPIARDQNLVAGMKSQGTALPIGDDSTRALDDRRQGEEVIEGQTGLDHEILEARGELAIGIAIATIDGEANGIAQALEARRVAGLREHRDIAGLEARGPSDSRRV
jgi:hypothetical protein